MSANFDFFKRVGNERLEVNSNGDVLKKYNGLPESWPTHTKVQLFQESHRSQQIGLGLAQRNITEFLKKI